MNRTKNHIISLLAFLFSSTVLSAQDDIALRIFMDNGEPLSGYVDTEYGSWGEIQRIYCENGKAYKSEIISGPRDERDGIRERSFYKDGYKYKQIYYQIVGAKEKSTTIGDGAYAYKSTEGGDYGDVPDRIIYFYSNGNDSLEISFFNVRATNNKKVRKSIRYYLNNSEGDIYPRIEYYHVETNNLKREVFYNEGKATGHIKDYYKNGSLHAEYTLLCKDPNDQYFSQGGSIIGPYFEYYSNGALKVEGNYAEDEKYKDWSPCDNSRTEKSGVWKYYYESGQIKGAGEMENDYMTGIWEYYHENGQLDSKGAYQRGERIGTWKVYNSSGNPMANLTFENKEYDEYTGIMTTFHHTGEVSGKGSFITKYQKDEPASQFNILPDGEWETFDVNGETTSKGSYYEGERINNWIFYDSNGKRRKEKFKKW